MMLLILIALALFLITLLIGTAALAILCLRKRRLSRKRKDTEIDNERLEIIIDSVTDSLADESCVLDTFQERPRSLQTSEQATECSQAPSLTRCASAPVLEPIKIRTSRVLETFNAATVISAAAIESLGSKKTQEDTHCIAKDSLPRWLQGNTLAAIFDGHNGASAALYVRDRLLAALPAQDEDNDKLKALQTALTKCEKDLYEAFLTDPETSSGTTAIAALFSPTEIAIANVGDSRAVLSRNGVAKELTTDHKPGSTLEKERILEAGGYIDSEDYINGELGVARALGNFHLPELKHPPDTETQGPLIADPDLSLVSIGKDDDDIDEFVILASDGLWDVMSSQRAIQFSRSALMRHDNCEMAAQELLREAERLETRDNTTVLIIALKDLPLLPKTPSQRRIKNQNSMLFRSTRSLPAASNEDENSQD